MCTRHFLPRFITLMLFCSLAVGQGNYNDGDKFAEDLRSGGKGPQMVVIPAGTLTLGMARGSGGDTMTVRFETSIAVGVHEITAGQYRKFLEATNSGELRNFVVTDENLPANGISWDEAEAYVTWLSRETGAYYRLPSATEWEYAARANTTTSYSWGDELGENRANCLDCGSSFRGQLAPVGSFPPNRWQLHDMHGNVWEWTKDCVDPNSAPPANGLPQLFGNCDSREMRGGSAESDGWSIRVSSRAFGQRKLQDSDVGFRVVRDLPE